MDKAAVATNILEKMEPLNTPFHLVALASIGTLIFIPEYHISQLPWNILITTISIVILFSITFSLFRYPIPSEKYALQLKFARSIGIASAILCILIAGEKALQFPGIFYKIFFPVIAQIIIFGFYIFIVDRTDKAKENNGNSNDNPDKKLILRRRSFLQLALITTALLVGIARNAHNGAEYYEKHSPESKIFFSPFEEDVKDKARSLQPNEYNIENASADSLLQNTVDSLSKTYSFVLSTGALIERYERIDNILFAFWLSCIVIWIYFIFKNLNSKGVFEGDVD